MMSLDKDFLRGSYPPIITPFKDGAVDYDTYQKLVEIQAKDSHGILVCGTTSEPSTLAVEERKKLLEIAVAIAKGRKPIVAATGSQSHAETVELTTHADKAGADALLIVTPYYIRPPQRGLVEYYADLGKRTQLPMMIYHIPGRAAVNVTVETVAAICDRVPQLVGIKHAVNDLEFVTKCLDRFGMDFRIFVGLEELSYPMMAVGACGLMNAVGNVLPKKVSQLCERVFAGDMKGARDLHYELFELNQAVFFDTNPIAIKYMMKKLGVIPRNEHRLPMVPATKELEERLDGVLKRAKLL
ncbi:MAG: 4-hydroxy-tetrahydrodipicolinate synthase [Rhodospirillales bacterium]